MEEERLWKFRRPEWLSSVWARNSGIYGAGAIVSIDLALELRSSCSYSLSFVVIVLRAFRPSRLTQRTETFGVKR